MFRAFIKAGCLSAVLMATACATTPYGSTVAVMPSPYKPYDVFSQDQAMCRGIASQAVSGQVQQANGRGLATALIGAALGAGLGAAIGDGRTTTIGAAYGGIAGTAIGASNSQRDSYYIQRQYDVAYEQCMYSKGNQVPGYSAGYGAPPAYGSPGYGAPPPPPPPGYR